MLDDNLRPLGGFGEAGSTDSPLDTLNAQLRKVADGATEKEKAIVDEIRESGSGVVLRTLSPAVCALIVINHNPHNRAMVVAKVLGMAEDMKTGDWKPHHQGGAFYADGTLADAQHRLAAAALAGFTITLPMMSDFPKESIDAIDRSKPRTADEALAMMGVENAKTKVKVARVAMDYVARAETGSAPRWTDQRIERWVKANESVLALAIELGEASEKNIATPVLKPVEASYIAALMLLGGWATEKVVAYLAAVQTGAATSDNSPTLKLSSRLDKAKNAMKNADRMSPREKVAYSLKAARLWAEDAKVNRLDWNQAKEGLPSYKAPLGEEVLP